MVTVYQESVRRIKERIKFEEEELQKVPWAAWMVRWNIRIKINSFQDQLRAIKHDYSSNILLPENKMCNEKFVPMRHEGLVQSIVGPNV